MENLSTNSKPDHPIVVIDDDQASLDFLSAALEGNGLRIVTAGNPHDGLQLIYKHHPQIVLTDLLMPGMTGLELLDRIVAFDSSIDVILLTAHYSTESAVDAIRRGACDYLDKPVNLSVLRKRVTGLLEQAERRRGRDLDSSSFGGMLGDSPAMWNLFSKIQRIAPHFRTVLITGSTGTGKDMAASTLHRLSPAANGHFVVLNCSAIVESLFESELFGHVKGSFTGAISDKVGLFEYADHGVLFLDEIGDMPLATQAKLLRALQNQEIQRIGSLQARKVNVRVIAATHRDLRALIAENKFREDLYYRLTMVEIHTPDLTERAGDLALLVHFLVKKFSSEFQKSIVGLTQRAEIALAVHTWPGNVRELENVLGHACMMASGERIDVQDLPDYLWPGESTPIQHTSGVRLSSLEEQERQLVMAAMHQSKGNQSEAARRLKIGRDALRYKLKKFSINP